MVIGMRSRSILDEGRQSQKVARRTETGSLRISLMLGQRSPERVPQQHAGVEVLKFVASCALFLGICTLSL